MKKISRIKKLINHGRFKMVINRHKILDMIKKKDLDKSGIKRIEQVYSKIKKVEDMVINQ